MSTSRTEASAGPADEAVAALGRFSVDDLERIRDAVGRAEAGTSGEIVTYIVGECDPYPEAGRGGALIGGMLGLLVSATLFALSDGWGLGPWLAFLPTVTGASIGYALGIGLPPLRRALIPGSVRDARTRTRAEAAFLEAEVFRTRDRTGLLLFIADFERRSIVLADEGLQTCVPDAEWCAVTETLLEGMGKGDAADAVLEAVERVGEVLAEHAPTRGEDDLDELPDRPVVRDA